MSAATAPIRRVDWFARSLVAAPGPESHNQETSIALERLVEGFKVDLRRSVWILQADPVATVVSPRFVNDGRFALKRERDAIVVEPVSTNVTDAPDGAQECEQRTKGQPAAGDLESVQRAIRSIDRICLHGQAGSNVASADDVSFSPGYVIRLSTSACVQRS